MPVTWFRPEFEGREDLLETMSDHSKRTGMPMHAVRGYLSRNSGTVKPVKQETDRSKYYVKDELDVLMKEVQSRARSPRPALERAQAEVARLSARIEEETRRVKVRENDLAKARRDLAGYRSQLLKAQNVLRTEELKAAPGTD